MMGLAAMMMYFVSEGSRHRLWDLLNSDAGHVCPYALDSRLLGF